MNNAGRNDPNDLGEDTLVPEDEPATQRSPILLLVLVAVLLVFLIIGIQAFGILYSIMFPPMPPLPQNVSEVRHTSIDHGVDEWLYQTEQNACDIASYYEIKGGQCRFTSDSCGDESSDEIRLSSSGKHVATCIGEAQFSLFAYRWEANIADGYRDDDGSTQFSLIREVFWTGAVPPRLDPRRGFGLDD
jgi:hypothetical protein